VFVILYIRMIMHLKKYFLLYTLIPLFILTTGALYYRFIVLQDYTVLYEVDCDPLEHTCYIGCEDDECIDEYYYNLVSRKAADIRALCGDDITDCDEAAQCPVEEISCSIDFCDADSLVDECTDITETEV
jgi:hypothetical protein